MIKGLPPYTNGQAQKMIEEYVHSERDRRILHRLLVDGLSFERVAEEADITPRHVSNIVDRYRSILFPHG